MTTYVVRDAGGEYIRYDGGRTPASDEAREWDDRDDALAACDRATDRVIAWEEEDLDDYDTEEE